jgi:hypothetical protein
LSRSKLREYRKKQAIVAIVRRLGELMYTLLKNGSEYERKEQNKGETKYFISFSPSVPSWLVFLPPF